MAISSSDIKFYKSTAVNDTDSNGGKISSTRIVTNTLNNLFPNVTSAERIAGVTRYRKMFMKNENASDLTLESTKVYIGMLSSGEDYFRFKDGTDTDIQSQADDYTNWHGSGTLYQSISSGESSIEVTYDAADGVFSGESVMLKIDDGTNSEEVQLLGTPSWAGEVATLNFTPVTTNSFVAGTTVVSTILDLDSIVAASSAWSETSAVGTYDESTYPVVMYNPGAVSDNWTLTFSSATVFSVAGALTGSLGAGNISTNFMPANGSSYYFKIDKSGWGGTWASGDTITFTTTHSAKAVWVKEVVPAGCAALSNNAVRFDWEGESA